MNYPQVLQDGQLVYMKNELTNNKQVLCEVIGFISQNGIYIIQQLKDIPRGILEGKIYKTTIDNLSTKKESESNG